MSSWTVKFEKPKKMLKNSRLGQLLAQISWPTEFFFRHAVFGSKLETYSSFIRVGDI